ncbi:MAG: tetratricopeptide repeat protein [Pseudomonadota bacterium]
MRKTGVILLALMITAMAGPSGATNKNAHECFAPDRGNRIAACSEYLTLPGLNDRQRASAFAMRALALSLLGQYGPAIKDYDKAIALNPNFPVALNNRAWAHYRSGNNRAAWPDVERSLALDPWSGHAYDTRAHLNQAAGNADAAYNDYVSAMRYGGARMVRLYQCGLQAQGHYNGALNGIVTDSLMAALKVCVGNKSCDPLPPDEECKAATS